MMMHWGRRRQRGTGPKSQKDFAQQALVNYTTKIMYNRWRMLCPFEVDTKLIYRALFSDEQHRATRLLVQVAPSMLVKRDTLNLVYDMPANVLVCNRRAIPTYLEITFTNELPLPDTDTTYGPPEHKFLLSQLPPTLREPLADWGQRWLVAARETQETLNKLTALFEVCNTMGQIKRVWANACNLLPEAARNKLAEAKVKSPYPDAVMDVWTGPDCVERKELKKEWQPAALEWYDTLLTEALCLPMVDGNVNFKESVNYSVVEQA